MGTAEVANGSLTSADVANGSLTSADVGLFFGTSTLDLPNIPGHSCAYSLVDPNGSAPDVDIDNDPVLVIADNDVSDLQHIVISPWRSNEPGHFRLRACNVTALAKDPGPANYHWVIFNN